MDGPFNSLIVEKQAFKSISWVISTPSASSSNKSLKDGATSGISSKSTSIGSDFGSPNIESKSVIKIF
jgi:hypothetical protein